MNASYLVRLAAAALPLFALQAKAADFSFSGHLTYNTDVVQVAFTLDLDASHVRLWTDSWQSGLNFDPTLTLWAKQGTGYSLVGDNAVIKRGEGEKQKEARVSDFRQAMAWLHKEGEVVEQGADEAGNTLVKVRLNDDNRGRFESRFSYTCQT